MISRAWRFCVSPLVGRDGDLSRTSVVIFAVLAMYALRVPLPELVALFIIVSSHGIKPLMAFIERTKVERQISTHEETVTTVIEDRRKGRDYEVTP